MNLKTITSAKDLPFCGVELIKVDKAITEVVIGGKLRIRVANGYSNALSVMAEAPYETGQRHRLTATIGGFDPKVSYFESEYEAKRAGDDFESKGATVAIDSVEVHIDDSGAVVPETAEPKMEAACDIPF